MVNTAPKEQPAANAISSQFSEGIGSLFTKSSGEQFIESQMEQTKCKHNLPLIKLFALTGFPLLALVLVAFASLLEAHWGIEHAEHMDNIVYEVDHIRGVIGALQKERSATCLFLNIDNSPKAVLNSRRIMSENGQSSANIISRLSLHKSSEVEEFIISQNEQSNYERHITLVKVITLTTLPLLALIGVAVGSLSEAHWGVEHAEHMEHIVSEVDYIRDIVGVIQKERSVTCLFLNINNSSSLGQMLLEEYREKTDLAFTANFDAHEDMVQFSAEVKELLEKLETQIQNYRNNLPASCSEVLIFYDANIDLLIAKINSLSRLDSDGHFWIDLFVRNLIWHVKENIGVKQAIGSSFYANGYLSKEDMKHYSAASSMGDSLMKILLTKSPEVKSRWSQLTNDERDLLDKIERMDKVITSGDGNDKSQSSTLDWFSTMNKYLNVMRILEHDLTLELASDVKSQRDTHSKHFLVVLLGIVAAVIFCSTLMLLHGVQSHRLTLKIRKYTIRMAEKNVKIALEKHKSEQLLAQMMPVSVTKKLLAGKSIDPETYEEATVFFSDVKDFTEICGRSSPLEVVNLLNELYMMFDGILDSYDCYKVETVGDGYMVVSGVPERNGHQHSNEICTMALEIMKSTSTFSIPHIPNQKLQLRIGIHTGSCASGIVGMKMPRFCLFGDTVNVAARMESHGIADRIQVTAETKGHLLFYHGTFECVLRNEIDVKGKGKVTTYWLVGKQNFNFRIEIPENDEW